MADERESRESERRLPMNARCPRCLHYDCVCVASVASEDTRERAEVELVPAAELQEGDRVWDDNGHFRTITGFGRWVEGSGRENWINAQLDDPILKMWLDAPRDERVLRVAVVSPSPVAAGDQDAAIARRAGLEPREAEWDALRELVAADEGLEWRLRRWFVEMDDAVATVPHRRSWIEAWECARADKDGKCDPAEAEEAWRLAWGDSPGAPLAAAPPVAVDEDAAWVKLTDDPKVYTSTRPREVFGHGFRIGRASSAAPGVTEGLREALQPFADIKILVDDGTPISVCVPLKNIWAARAALAVSPAPTFDRERRDGLSPEQVEKLKALGWCGCNTACALLPVEQARTGRKCRYVAGEVKPISKLSKAASDLVDATVPTEGPDDA